MSASCRVGVAGVACVRLEALLLLLLLLQAGLELRRLEDPELSAKLYASKLSSDTLLSVEEESPPLL